MMKEETLAKIIELLQQKKDMFLEYEQATSSILDGEADTAENYITKRSELATKIDFLTEQVGRICDGEDDTDLLLNIINARCNFEMVPKELHGVYEVGQEIRGVVARIVSAEKMVEQKLVGWRDEALVKIRENQNLPKIKKYLTDLAEEDEGNRLSIGKI